MESHHVGLSRHCAAKIGRSVSEGERRGRALSCRLEVRQVRRSRRRHARRLRQVRQPHVARAHQACDHRQALQLHRRAPELSRRARAVHLGDRRSRWRRHVEGQSARGRAGSRQDQIRHAGEGRVPRRRPQGQGRQFLSCVLLRTREQSLRRHAMTDVYVVGTDMIKFGRFPERSVPELGAQAALMALDDCGLTIQDMQALYSGNLFEASGGVGQRILREIGQTGIPVVNTANACATGATAFREGWMAIKAGVYDIVLCVGSEQMGTGLLGGAGGGKGIPTEGLLGSGTMPSVFAHVGLEHTRKYGTTFEQFAKVSVKNHHHSTLNAKAMYQKETPLEEVMGAEMISYPNTKLMCSVNVDGSAAAVLVSEKKAKQLGLKRAVKIRASVLTSDPWQERDLVMPDVNTCTRIAAKKAYEMAGVGA